MPSALLEAVRIASDAIREKRLWDAFAILGPDGEAAQEFEHLKTPNGHQGAFRTYWSWIYDEEEYAAEYEERSIDYDAAVALYREKLREDIAHVSKREWKEPSKVVAYDQVLKEIYTPEAINNVAIGTHPLFNLVTREAEKPDNDGIQVRLRSWVNLVNVGPTAVIKR